jgi:uncharacterized protein YdeI (YjbR/CyaY-like superfamily)
MAKRDLTDQKIRARQLYTVQGVTNLQHIAQTLGVTRQTVARWKEDGAWESAREDQIVTPLSLAARMKRILSKYIAEIETMQTEGTEISPSQVKRLKDYSDMLRKLDDQYDFKGNTVNVMDQFIDFVSKQKQEKELLLSLQRVLPQFFRYVESTQ